MKCNNCPLFHSWNNESDCGAECVIFGDGWDNRFQYEDSEGTTVGCYIDRAYINKVEKKMMEYYESLVEIAVEAERKKESEDCTNPFE